MGPFPNLTTKRRTIMASANLNAAGSFNESKKSAGSIIREMICANPSVSIEAIKDVLIKQGYGDKYKLNSLQIAYNEINAVILELRKHYKLVAIETTKDTSKK